MHAIKTAEELFEKKIYLVSLKDKVDLSTAMGKCVFTMSCAFFALERDKTSERTSAALQHLSKEGKLRAKPLFGWKYVGPDKVLEPVPEQQAVIKRIIELYKGGMKVSGISTKLNQEGLNTCLTLNKKPEDQGKVQIFYPQTVKRILMDEGLIKDEKIKRPPVQQRITSHHKPAETQNKSTENQNKPTENQNKPTENQNIVRTEGSGLILEIIS